MDAADFNYVLYIVPQGFPHSSVGKESTCNAGDPGSIPQLERSAGEERGYPLQDSWASFSGLAGTESSCNAGDLGLIPELGRSPGEEKGYPLQYSGLENSVDCIVHGITKNQTQLSNFCFTSFHMTRAKLRKFTSPKHLLNADCGLETVPSTMNTAVNKIYC